MSAATASFRNHSIPGNVAADNAAHGPPPSFRKPGWCCATSLRRGSALEFIGYAAHQRGGSAAPSTDICPRRRSRRTCARRRRSRREHRPGAHHAHRDQARRTADLRGPRFGNVGAYEKLVGRAFGEVDPKDPRNAVIVDIAHAPKNARGMVEYDTDFMILKPVDLANGNHRLWFEVNNRGNSRRVPAIQRRACRRRQRSDQADDAGNGFMMRQGYTIVEAGWDISAPAGDGRFTIRVPVAKIPTARRSSGRRWKNSSSTTTAPSRRLTYPAASLDKSQATLTVRTRYEDDAGRRARRPMGIRRTKTARPSASCRTTRRSRRARSTLSPIRRRTRWSAGLGFAALRDSIRSCAMRKRDDAGTANPLAGYVNISTPSCRSQPCRTLHDYLWLGFNRGRSRTAGGVDGIENWIGGSTGIFTNFRFGQPGRTHRQHIARWYPEFQGPFTNRGGARSRHRQDRRAARALHRQQHLSRRSSRRIRRTNIGRRTWPSASSTPTARTAPPSPPMCATISSPACSMAARSARRATASASSRATR